MTTNAFTDGWGVPARIGKMLAIRSAHDPNPLASVEFDATENAETWRRRPFGLATAAAGAPIDAVDLDHRHVLIVQVAGQSGAVGAGAFHRDPEQTTVIVNPGR